MVASAPAHPPARRGVITAMAGFGAVALPVVIALIVLIPSTGDAGVRFEVVKALIQVLGVAVLGGVVSLTAFLVQRDRIERHEIAQRLRIEQQENLRRDADRRLEDRRHEDEFLRGVHDDAIATYNAIKKVRRLALSAVERDQGVPAVAMDDYRARIAQLNDQQLVLERLARLVPLMHGVDLTSTEHVDKSGRPRCLLRVVEDSVNEILHESQVRGRSDRRLLALTDVPRFLEFLKGEDRASLSRPVRTIVLKLQERLTRPVELPDAG